MHLNLNYIGMKQITNASIIIHNWKEFASEKLWNEGSF